MIKNILVKVQNLPDGNKDFYIATIYTFNGEKPLYVISCKGSDLDKVMSDTYEEVGGLVRDFTGRGFEVRIREE